MIAARWAAGAVVLGACGVTAGADSGAVSLRHAQAARGFLGLGVGSAFHQASNVDGALGRVETPAKHGVDTARRGRRGPRSRRRS